MVFMTKINSLQKEMGLTVILKILIFMIFYQILGSVYNVRGS